MRLERCANGIITTRHLGRWPLRGTARRQTWVVGAAAEQDTFQPQDVPQFAYRYTVPGVFAQDDLDLTRWLAISASGRLDDHSQYGTFFSPGLSALVRSGRWNSRLSVGTGFFASTPLTEETESAGLSRLIDGRWTVDASAPLDGRNINGGVRVQF